MSFQTPLLIRDVITEIDKKTIYFLQFKGNLFGLLIKL